MKEANLYGAQATAVRKNNAFLANVYAWMFFAMLLSAGSVIFLLYNPVIAITVMNYYFVLIILELGLVFSISFFMNRLSYISMAVLFIIYSILNGLTLSAIIFAYSPIAVLNVFLITSGVFLFMSIYGYFTNSDLSGFGKIMFFGLIGIILAMLINFLLQSSMLDFVISCIGVLVFVGLIAYDTQELKLIGEREQKGESKGKLAIMGALKLYLDFINLFIFLLRLFGGRD